jgi:hypothetical protein
LNVAVKGIVSRLLRWLCSRLKNLHSRCSQRWLRQAHKAQLSKRPRPQRLLDNLLAEPLNKREHQQI